MFVTDLSTWSKPDGAVGLFPMSSSLASSCSVGAKLWDPGSGMLQRFGRFRVDNCDWVSLLVISSYLTCNVGLSLANTAWLLNHRMSWKGHSKPVSFQTLLWEGTFSTRPGCSQLHSAWPGTVPRMAHPQLLWVALFHCLTALTGKNSLSVSNVTLLSVSLEQFLLVLLLQALVQVYPCLSYKPQKGLR